MRYLLLTLIVAVLGACRTGPQPIIEQRDYPRDLERGPSLDIQVFRMETKIELTNTTAQSFGSGTIWLNERFSHDIDGLAVGQTLTLKLSSFRDRYNDAFRAGGFWATEPPERLVLAELEAQGRLYGLIVVGGEEN